MPTPAHVVRFGVFELDTQSGELRRHGLKIRLPDQSFQILKVLLRRPGEVVTRDELRHVLWTSDTFVDFEVGLNSAVRKLREALDDSAENPRFVETLPRRGYRFVGSVSVSRLDSAHIRSCDSGAARRDSRALSSRLEPAAQRHRPLPAAAGQRLPPSLLQSSHLSGSPAAGVPVACCLSPLVVV